MSRIEKIEKLLKTKLSIDHFQIIDESNLHVGHPGASSGGGHFNIKIVSKDFIGKNRLERHRIIYGYLHDMMDRDIHALALNLITPSENIIVTGDK